MAELKTKQTDLSVDVYIDAIADANRRQDCLALVDLMRKATQEEPKMWGTGIVGFGRYHYKYASGHEGDSCLTGFASRKQALTIYLMPGFEGYESLLADLGKYKPAKGCLYLKRLADVNLQVLRELIERSVQELKRRHPTGV
jgi:hypothetical protein